MILGLTGGIASGKSTVSNIFKKYGIYIADADKIAKELGNRKDVIDEIGEKIGQSIVNYFADEKNVLLVNRLKEVGLQFTRSEEHEQISDKLNGLSIVISGVFVHHSRDEYKNMIEQNGGKNVGSISSKTSFILAGDNMGPSKLEKATKLGIHIISEEEFLKLIL